ncbi:uncharacterized protein LOC135480327 [Liolophura sinensis]|uniref:uncharacterized protein LOC135480327 n=1 Tax=Liolophura sinensis TaxID=3198878 RepID=UPI0031594B77
MKTENLISGKGRRLSANETDIYILTSKDAEDLGPVCKVSLHLTNSGSDLWAMRHLTVRHLATNDIGTFGRNNCTGGNNTWNKPVTYKRNEPADPWKVWGKCSCETRTRRRLPDPCMDAGGVDDEKTCTPDECPCAHVMMFAVIGSVLGFLALPLFIGGVVCCIRHNQPSAPVVNAQGINEYQAENSLVPCHRCKMLDHSSPLSLVPRTSQECELEYIYI